MSYTTKMTLFVFILLAFLAGGEACADGSAISVAAGFGNTRCCTASAVKSFSYTVDGGSHNDNIKVNPRIAYTYVMPIPYQVLKTCQPLSHYLCSLKCKTSPVPNIGRVLLVTFLQVARNALEQHAHLPLIIIAIQEQLR